MVELDLSHPFTITVAAAVLAAGFTALGRWWGRARRDQSALHKLDKIVAPWFEEPGPSEDHDSLPTQVKGLAAGQRQLSTELVTHMQQEEDERRQEAAHRAQRQAEQDAFRERADARMARIEEDGADTRRRVTHIEQHLGIGDP